MKQVNCIKRIAEDSAFKAFDQHVGLVADIPDAQVTDLDVFEHNYVGGGGVQRRLQDPEPQPS
ncbi:hypothetical protein APX01_19635 (plasmid) [Cereibacter sphaeroides]|nr:hypothetical protein APX01_19635 [Cereibacter sphaeroides]ANS36536.1 hypothetical protein A3858_19915 [Cereibacter sphaeroides]ATN65548.1 hypothetical protein A3857_19660 [Cereibacter sphaeroides]